MYESDVENEQGKAADAKAVVVANAASEHRECRWWFLRTGSAIAIPLLLLVVVEICLRVFNVGYPTDLTQPCTIHGQPAACYNLFFPAPFFPPGMIKTPEAYAIPADEIRGN